MKKLGEVLIARGLITESQLRSALGEQARWGNRIGEVLVQQGFVSEAELIPVLSEQLGCQSIDLSGREIHPDVIGLIPGDVAIKYACLPVARKAGAGTPDVFYVAMEDPTNLIALDDVTFRTGCTVRPLLAGSVQLRHALSTCYASGPVEYPVVLEVDSEAAMPQGGLDANDGLAQEIWLDEVDGSPLSPGETCSAPPSDAGSSGGFPDRRTLQALIRLLLRKGILTPEELAAEVQKLGGSAPS